MGIAPFERIPSTFGTFQATSRRTPGITTICPFSRASGWRSSARAERARVRCSRDGARSGGRDHRSPERGDLAAKLVAEPVSRSAEVTHLRPDRRRAPWYSRLVAAPALFTRLPQETQDRIAYRSIRPACSHFVKVRIDGIKMTMGTEVTAAEPIGDEVRLTLTDGTQREVDHLMFGTGYKVDVTRYPFLSEGLLSELRVVDGYPVLTRGFETSVPRLHMLGAPAARSFGPTLRFVSGSWYAGTRLASALAPARRRVPSGLQAPAAPKQPGGFDRPAVRPRSAPGPCRHVGTVPAHSLRGSMIRCNDWRLDRLATTPSEKADSPHWRRAPSNVCSSTLVAAWLAM